MGRLVLTRRKSQSVKVGEILLTIRDIESKRIYIQLQGRPATWVALREVVHIPELAQITVSEINRGHVKLVFDADRSVTIMRSELLPS